MAETVPLAEINVSKIVPQKINQETIKDMEFDTLKVYKKRWFILFIFFFYAFSNLMQAYSYTVIADLLVKFYGISFNMAEWTTTSGIVIQAVTLIPCSYVVDKLGLRHSVIIGIVGTAIGSWIKAFSAEQSRFWVFFLGKSIVSLFQVFIMALPAKIAAVWFGNDQVSTACFIAVVEADFSYTLGMFAAPMFVQQGTIEEIGTGLQNFAYFPAILSSILIPILIIFFSNAPPTKPSIAQVVMENKKSRNILKSLRQFLTNRSFLIFLTSFGLSIGVVQPIFINSSQIVAYYHPDDSVNHLGNIITLSTVGGMIGSFILGRILDRFGCFKLATICLFVSLTVVCVLHLSMMMFDVRILYGTGFLMGFTFLPMYNMGYAMVVELTHPEPECVAGTIMQVTGCVFSVPIAHLHSFLFTAIGPVWSNIVIYGLAILGNLLLFGVKFDLKRQRVENNKNVKI